MRYPYVKFTIYLEPRNIWIGLTWKRHRNSMDIYINLIPMIQINIFLQWNVRL